MISSLLFVFPKTILQSLEGSHTDQQFPLRGFCEVNKVVFNQPKDGALCDQQFIGGLFDRNHQRDFTAADAPQAQRLSPGPQDNLAMLLDGDDGSSFSQGFLLLSESQTAFGSLFYRRR
jgi:hypothetical protein